MLLGHGSGCVAAPADSIVYRLPSDAQSLNRTNRHDGWALASARLLTNVECATTLGRIHQAIVAPLTRLSLLQKKIDG